MDEKAVLAAKKKLFQFLVKYNVINFGVFDKTYCLKGSKYKF